VPGGRPYPSGHALWPCRCPVPFRFLSMWAIIMWACLMGSASRSHMPPYMFSILWRCNHGTPGRRRWAGAPEDRVDTGCDKVVADGDGLFTHPFRSGSGRGQIADVVAQAAGFDHFGGRQQDAAVVHAGAQVQDRRDTHGFADFGQARAAVHLADSGVSSPSMAQAMPLQPVVRTMTSFLISSLTT
jgi:hypothetical protein